MAQVWVNSKWLTSDNPKDSKWKPAPEKKKVLWGLCLCAEPIYEGDAVGMVEDHKQVTCYVCWLSGALPDGHLDCAGLQLPYSTLSQ